MHLFDCYWSTTYFRNFTQSCINFSPVTFPFTFCQGVSSLQGFCPCGVPCLWRVYLKVRKILTTKVWILCWASNIWSKFTIVSRKPARVHLQFWVFWKALIPSWLRKFIETLSGFVAFFTCEGLRKFFRMSGKTCKSCAVPGTI